MEKPALLPIWERAPSALAVPHYNRLGRALPDAQTVAASTPYRHR